MPETQAASAAKSAQRVIKKYPNRRLYDTTTSTYITLAEVKQLVMASENLVVRDAKTGEDITRSILLQIILEEEAGGAPMFSEAVLANIIRFYGHAMQGFMGSYLERSMQVFLDQQTQFRSQMNNILGQTPWSVLNDMTERNLELWKQMQSKFIGEAPLKAQPKPGDRKR